MSVNKKAGAGWKETRHDKWYVLAKEQGYRSRAAFKLIQLNKKYQFLDSCKSCLDLGAAPGGWLQVAQKFMPVSSMIIGVDLVPIARMRGVTTIQADITTPECRTLIKKELQGWDVDLVLCDGAPNVAGGQVWSRDAYQQNELVIHALKLATHFLRPKGTFVTKVFRSQDYNALLWALKQLFEIVDVTKPMASRNASAEIFVVCRYYKAPKKIDPFLLDPAHIFQQFDTEHAKVKDVFKDKGKATRSRQGYEESEMNGLIGVTCDVMEFVRAEEPITLLGSYQAFTFDSEDAKMILSHSATNDEVQTLCRDLKVLGKGDFKALLKWRKKVQTFLKELEKEAAGPKEVEEEKPVIFTEEELAEKEENDMTAAIAAYHERRQKHAKALKRKRHEAKQKQAQRLAINANNLNGVSEMVGGNEGGDQTGTLFQLGAIDSEETLNLLDRAADEIPDSESGEDQQMSESDSEDEESYYENLEKRLDSMYDAYKAKRGVREKKDLEEKALADEDKLYAEIEEEAENQRVGSKRKRSDDSDDESEEESDDEEFNNPLLVDLGNKAKESSMVKAQRWFDRDLFEGIDDSNEMEDDEQPKAKGPKRMTLTDMMNMEVMSSDSDDSDAVDSDGDLPSRWLAEDDETIEQARPITKKARVAAAAAAATSSKPARAPLVGLASMGKTRAALEQEKVLAARQAKKAEKDARRAARKAQEAMGLVKGGADDDDEVMVEESLTSDKDVGELLKAGRNFRNLAADLDAADSSDDEVGDVVDLDSKKKQKKLARRAAREAGNGHDSDADDREGAGFEEVAAISDYSDNDDAVSTTLALGTRAIMKKQREELLDSSYNRYAVDLREQRGLPQWFIHEERLHNTGNLPVTKEEVSALKQRLRAINAKPIKKIAEAAARNKQRTERRWQKIKQQMDEVAESITSSAGTGEGNMVSKIRQMEKLAKKKDKRQEKGDKKYMVTRKGGGSVTAKQKSTRGGKGGATIKVDARLKKDKRGMKKARENAKTTKKTSNKRRRNQ